MVFARFKGDLGLWRGRPQIRMTTKFDTRQITYSVKQTKIFGHRVHEAVTTLLKPHFYRLFKVQRLCLICYRNFCVKTQIYSRFKISSTISDVLAVPPRSGLKSLPSSRLASAAA